MRFRRSAMLAALAGAIALAGQSGAAVAVDTSTGLRTDGTSEVAEVERPATLRLGGVFPLTGPMASAGTAMMQGVQAVLTEVNAAGGVDGTRLELVVGDDRFDSQRGKDLVEQQIGRDGVFAFAGIFSPHTIEAALPAIRDARIPVVSPGGADDREFAEPMLFPVTSPCGRQMAGNVQHLVRDLNLQRLAVITGSNEAQARCSAQLGDVARTLGAQVVHAGNAAPAGADCAAQVLAARAASAQALIVNADNLTTMRCLQARAHQDWAVPASISYTNTDDPMILRTLGPTAQGLLSSSPFTGASSTEFEAQCGAIAEYYPNAKIQFWSLVGCLGTKLLVAGLQAAGADRTALINALESGRAYDSGGLAPLLNYGPGKRLPYDLTATVEVRGEGNWVRTGPLYTPTRPGDVR